MIGPEIAGRHLPAPPEPGEVVAWPDSFGRRFSVFVDIEEEFDWSKPLDPRNRSVTATAALPEAHRRFAERGIGWTCMVDHPVATDPHAVSTIRALCADGRTTIGSQLHSWVTPPFVDGEGAAGGYPGRLPADLEAAKLDTLTDAIEHAFGERPVAYRAGRYGLGEASWRLLRDRGYRVDSSVRARFSYADDGGPDFSRFDGRAFGRDGVLELPLTTVYVGHLRRRGAALYRAVERRRWARAAFARSRALSRVPLTPEGVPWRTACSAIDAALEDGLRLLTLSFHSPSLVPGHTPYVRDRADLVRFHRWWDHVLDHLERCDVKPASLNEILRAATPT